METDQTDDPQELVDDGVSSIDEGETNSECGSYVYMVNQDDLSEDQITDSTNSSKKTMTKNISKGMFYRRTANPTATVPSKNTVGMLKEQFESQNMLLGGTVKPNGTGSEKQNVGQLKQMFEKRSQNVPQSLPLSSQGSGNKIITSPVSPQVMIEIDGAVKDILDSSGAKDVDCAEDGIDDTDSIGPLNSPDDFPMTSISPLHSPVDIPMPSGPIRYRPSSLRHLGHLKVTPVDIVPSRLQDLPSQEELDELRQELTKHMDKLSVPRPSSAQGILDEDEDRAPIYV